MAAGPIVIELSPIISKPLQSSHTRRLQMKGA